MMMNETSNTNLDSSNKSGFETNSFDQHQHNKNASNANSASSGNSTTVQKGKHLVEVAGVKAKQANAMMVSRIRENPLSAVGIALGAGFGLALLRR